MVHETLNICSHGVPVKMGCNKCMIERRVEKLEEILPRYDELHKEWWTRIEELEKLAIFNMSPEVQQLINCQMQNLIKRIKVIEDFIGQNYKADIERLSKKIDEIIDFDNSIKESMTMLNNRISAIVKDNDEKNMRRIEENTLISRRLTEVERFQDITNLQYKARKTDKIPYRCPLCDGKEPSCYKEKYMQAHIHTDECFCHACEGKGIVWSP